MNDQWSETEICYNEQNHLQISKNRHSKFVYLDIFSNSRKRRHFVHVVKRI